MEQTELFLNLEKLRVEKVSAVRRQRPQSCYYAIHEQFKAQAAFMASNIHHAANKALKHWGPEVMVSEETLKNWPIISQTKMTKLVKAWRSK